MFDQRIALNLKEKLNSNSFFVEESSASECRLPAIVATRKIGINFFPKGWFNLSLIATDLDDSLVDIEAVDKHINENYIFNIGNESRILRIFKPMFVTISILYSKDISCDAKEYCRELKTHYNSNAIFQIPVVVDKKTGDYVLFKNNPIVGYLTHTYVKKIIVNILGR